MDYRGQRLAELIYIYLIVAVGAVAWVCGYVAESFQVTFGIWLVGLVVAMILCVPDWSFLSVDQLLVVFVLLCIRPSFVKKMHWFILKNKFPSPLQAHV